MLPAKPSPRFIWVSRPAPLLPILSSVSPFHRFRFQMASKNPTSPISLDADEPSPKVPKLSHNDITESLDVSPFLRVKKLSENAVMPSRASPLSGGYDLSSAVETKVPARGKALVPTDLSIAIPDGGTYGRIAPRSGFTWKHSIAVGAGVIDADYRGPVGVILFNHSDVDFTVKPGGRIAQMIIQMISTPKVEEVEDLDAITESRDLSPFLRVKKLSKNAVMPSRASPLSAGYDLSSAVETKVPARGKVLVPTDLSIAIADGTYARIAPRSGLTWKHSIDVGDGVIDADYRGPVGVSLFNHSDVDFTVKPGDRIAQMIIEMISTPEAEKVEDLDAIPESRDLSPFLRVKKLSENAVMPSRASPLSAGYDLSSVVETKVPAHGKALVPTDLSIAISGGTYARIAPRSELFLKHSIYVGDDVIYADYRGPVGVSLFNHSDVDFTVKPGDRIAQMIIQMISTPKVGEVEELDATIRGAGGFGSTGV